MRAIAGMKRQGLNIQAISRLLVFDRKTVRKYLIEPGRRPEYPRRPKPPGKLDEFRPHLEERLRAGVWNAQGLLRELHGRGYDGGYTILAGRRRPVGATSARSNGAASRTSSGGRVGTT